jgi:hypothetical protein
MAGHTFGNIAAQALELLTCAPRIKYGLPSTSNPYRPDSSTSRGISAGTPATAHGDATAASVTRAPATARNARLNGSTYPFTSPPAQQT